MEEGIVEWEDLELFFDDFAIPATLAFAEALENDAEVSEATLELRGIFETPYQKRDFGAFIVDADDPSFTCKWTEALQAARKGDTLTINGEVFYLETAAMSDGTGLASFTLTRASTQDAQGDDFSAETEDSQQMNSGRPSSGSLFGPGY